jgi:hypothetical protein
MQPGSQWSHASCIIYHCKYYMQCLIYQDCTILLDKFDLYYITSSAGFAQPLLWGEAVQVGERLLWCEGGTKVALPTAVAGSTEKLFLLATLPGNSTQLHALPLETEVRFSNIFCLHSQAVKDDFDNGRRSAQLSPFEKLLAKISESNKIKKKQ